MVFASHKKNLIECLFGIVASIGKINFNNLSRHTALSEKTFSRQFKQDFDFAHFNKIAIDKVMKTEETIILLFDQSFIPKSGKKTYGIEQFWNGTKGKAEKGQEISLLSLASVAKKDAMALAAVQTPTQAEIKKELNNDQANRVDWYLHFLKQHYSSLPDSVRHLVADALHANIRCVDQVVANKLDIVSRLRINANLRYLYDGPQKSRGRHKKFDDKVRFTDLSRFKFVKEIDSKTKLYTAIVYSISLKRNIRLALLVRQEKSKVKFVPLFSTDTNLSASNILKFYSTRFQIEFLFRDAKQFTGLTNCQARNREALDFHFNASFSALNLAKVKHYELYPESHKVPFSMFSWKVRMHNENLLNLVFSKLGVTPTCKKIDPPFQELLNFGVIQC